MKLSKLASLASATLLSLSSRAALVSVDIDGNTANGNEGVYDNVLDITWLADANLADNNSFGVSGIRTAGDMRWATAQTFLNAINGYDTHGYLGISSWRLPFAAPVSGGAYDLTFTYDGSTDRSYQLSASADLNNPLGQSAGFTGSELAYHYYNNFEAIGECHGNGTTKIYCNDSSTYGIDNAPDSNNYKALFSNIQTHSYWTAAELDDSTALIFYTSSGFQYTSDKSHFRNLWLVADGNLSASTVPVPAAAFLFGPALAGLLVLRRNKRHLRNAPTQ